MKNPQIATKRLQHEQVIGVLLSTNSDRQTGMRTATAMSRIYAYLVAARNQVRAIEALEKKADPNKPSYSSTMIQAFIHAHLYFTCWAAIGRMIEVVRRCSGLKPTNKVWKKYRAGLKQYTDARDYLEHYDERLPGGKKSAGLANPTDYGNLRAGLFSLGGFKWDVSHRSAGNLNVIVEELTHAILSGS